MTRSKIAAIGIAFCLALIALGLWKICPRYYQLNVAGHTLHAPWGWRVFSDNTFVRVRFDDKLPATVEVVDRRSRPDHSDTFVASWIDAAHSKSLRGFTVTEYRDPIVDQMHMRCVVLRSKSPGPNPLILYCTTAGGHWRLDLLGNDSDIRGLDEIAKQMFVFEDK